MLMYQRLYPYMLPIVLISAYIFHILHYRTSMANPVHPFMFVVIMYMVYVYHVDDGTQAVSKNAAKSFMDKYTQDRTLHLETDQYDVYNDSLMKHPTKFLYMPKYPELQELYYEMRFIRPYDEHSFLQAILLTERFLKVYFKALLLERDDQCKLLYNTLKSIKRQVLDAFQTMTFNTPLYFKRSYLADKTPTNAYINARRDTLHAFFNDKLLVLSLKCNKNNEYHMRATVPQSMNEIESPYVY